MHYAYALYLPFYNHWHHDRGSPGYEIAIFREFTTEHMNKFWSFDAIIRKYSLFIGIADSFQDLLVNCHHLMRVDESTRIDKNMSDNRSCTDIFFDDKGKYTIFSKDFTISESVSCSDADRIFIDIKCIKSKFERMFRCLWLQEIDDLSRNKCKCISSYKTIPGIGLYECDARLSRLDYPGFWEEKSIRSRRQHDTSRYIFEEVLPYFSIGDTWRKKLEESTSIEKNTVFYGITNICNNFSCCIYMRESE